MIFSISEHLAYSFMPHDLTIDRLKDAIRKELNISACQFKSFHKNKENFMEAGECLIFDFDYCLDMTVIIDQLKDFKYLIHTTKNHKKAKNGVLADRFRLYLFCNKVTLKMDEYEQLLSSLCNDFGSDPQSAVCSLAFKGFKDCLFYENDGALFDWELYFNTNKSQMKKEKQQTKKEFKEDIKSFMDETKWKVMFSPQNITSGNRNASFARILLWVRDKGCDRYEAEKILMWVNNEISEPLPSKEISQLIKSKYK